MHWIMQKFLTLFMHHIIFIFNTAVDINYSVSVQFKESNPSLLCILQFLAMSK